MQYLALIGDIVGSKEIVARAALQKQLEGTLRRLSERKPRLGSPYTITLGDEFQAVYKSPDNLFLDIFSILAAVHPARVRFGLGVGALTTPLNSKQALGMDGPAFHRAREAMIELKDSSALLRLKGDPSPPGPAFDPWKLLNHALDLVSHQVGAWEKNRLRILCGLLAGESVAELEQELAVSKVAVYKNINAAALHEVTGLCGEITRFLNDELNKP